MSCRLTERSSPSRLLRERLRTTGLCAILDTGIADAKGLPGLARELKAAGVRVFQLRAKNMDDGPLLNLAGRLRGSLGGCSFMINDRPDIAALAGADGVHLGQEDMPARMARRIVGKGRAIGVSAGNRAEARKASLARPDYVSLGPAFMTRTKPDAGRPLGPAGLRRLARFVRSGPLKLAVGGITAHNVMVTLKSGIDAVAVSSGMLRFKDPGSAAARILAAIESAKSADHSESKPGGRRW